MFRKKLFAVFIMVSLLLSACGQTAFIPAPGKMVDAGGYKMHLNCIGQPKDGTPTMVLFSGAMGYSTDWGTIPEEISKQNANIRVCTYDRAGLGWSEMAPETVARSLENGTKELHTALINAGEKAPFALIAHSWGGQFAIEFSSLYPDEVWHTGILLDPATKWTVPAIFGDKYPEYKEVVKTSTDKLNLLIPLCKTGAMKTLNVTPPEFYLMPTQDKDAVLQNYYNCSQQEVMITEMLTIAGTFDEFQSVMDKGIKTRFLVLQSEYGISSEFTDLFDKGFPFELYNSVNRDEQTAIVNALNNGSTVKTAMGSGHYIQLQKPQEVLDLIPQMLK